MAFHSEWINLKTTPLRFRVYSQSVYFVKRPSLDPSRTLLRHITATTTWTNNERLSFYSLTLRLINVFLFIFLLLCWVCIQRAMFMRILQVIVFSVFSVSLWQNNSVTILKKKILLFLNSGKASMAPANNLQAGISSKSIQTFLNLNKENIYKINFKPNYAG